MIEIKTAEEIAHMREAGRIVARLLEHLTGCAKPGITTQALDGEARRFLERHGSRSAFLGYRGFPASICVSVNDEVVHGIPGERRICAGDLVSVDAGAIVNGWYADAATTIAVGSVAPRAKRLCDVTRRALEAGIAQAVVGRRLSDISHAVQQVIEREGFSVVRAFVGHGIGRQLHEEPQVPNFGSPNAGPRLGAGMVLAIEPMVTAGTAEVHVRSDGWTAVTADRSLAAHEEHTVAVTEHGPEILTRP